MRAGLESTLLGAVIAGIGLLSAAKSSAVTAYAEAHGLRVRSAVSLSAPVRALFGASALFSGLLLLDHTRAALFLIAAGLLAFVLLPFAAATPIGTPRVWKMVSVLEAFPKEELATLGPIRMTRWTILGLLATSSALVVSLGPVRGSVTVLALLVVFSSPRHSGKRDRAQKLAALRGIVRTGVRAAPVAADTFGVREVRLLFVPKEAISGIVGFEVAFAPDESRLSGELVPRLFIRLKEGSDASERAAHVFQGSPLVVGRTMEERVITLSDEQLSRPRSVGEWESVVGLMNEHFHERRAKKSGTHFRGVDRRESEPALAA